MSDIIVDKSHKLASAIYLVTSFFVDQEPLKWKLRGLCGDLVSDNIKDKHRVTHDVRTLFSLAKNASLVSEVNYTILANELARLEDELKKPIELSFSIDKHREEKMLSIESNQDFIKDNIDARTQLKEYGAVSVKRNSRQSIIIGLLKRKKEMMIKDVTPLISGCSEKTVQRELLAMVEEGLLKKTGEKRWSRYSLA